MLKYIIKRILLAFLTAFIIITITFLLMKTLPYEIKGTSNQEINSFLQNQCSYGYVYDCLEQNDSLGKCLFVYADEAARITHYYYLVPPFIQYFKWIGRIFTEWDWGTSTVISYNLSAIKIISDRLPVSIQLNIIASLISVPIGLALGILAALKKNTKLDAFISTVVMILISIPSFVLITLLISAFSDFGNLGWLPNSWPKSTDSASKKFLGYIIPVMSLSLGSIAGYTRFTRAELCEVLSSDYLLLARTKGLTKRQAILRHALRNAMVPIVPSILADFIFVMSGSMILENLYSIPGIGSLFIEALQGKDYNVLMVDMAIFTTFSLLAGVLLDLSYGFIDPRIRMGAKK